MLRYDNRLAMDRQKRHLERESATRIAEELAIRYLSSVEHADKLPLIRQLHHAARTRATNADVRLRGIIEGIVKAARAVPAIHATDRGANRPEEADDGR